jgi:hypothetical protein
MFGLSNERLRDLILSVGTHKKDRPLSPFQVAESFKIAMDSGVTKEQLAELVQLKDFSIISRFLTLLKLNPEIKDLVDWGKKKSTISFMSASIISRLNFDNQRIIAEKIMENGLNKNEIIQIIQIHERSRKSISESTQEVLNLRPVIQKTFVFIGKITDNELINILSKLTQNQRDLFLRSIIEKGFKIDNNWDCRLGSQGFSLSGGENFAFFMNQLQPDFEDAITQWIKKEVNNVN